MVATSLTLSPVSPTLKATMATPSQSKTVLWPVTSCAAGSLHPFKFVLFCQLFSCMFTFNLALRPTRFSAYSTRTSRALLSSRRFYSTSPAACPSCSTPLPTALPTCPKCSHIEPLPASTSYHDIFGLQANPNPFIVDTKELKSRFLQAQRVCHPDAWSRKGEVCFYLSTFRQ